MYTDSFGFLREPVELQFDTVTIKPIAEYAEVKQLLFQESNRDGFLYPPTKVAKTKPIDNEEAEWTEIPRSERPALTFLLPASHIITIDNTSNTVKLRSNDSGLIMYLLAYLYRCRLQFYDWTIDGNIPIDKKFNDVHATNKIATDFLSTAYNTWKNSTQDKQKQLVNILYMHSKSPAYNWTWESFIIEYMTLDAIWKCDFNTRKDHSRRIEKLCKKYSLYRNESLIKEIVDIRNNLMHESLWDNTNPCFSESQESYNIYKYLREINNRLIPAIFGWNGKYIKSVWDQWTCRFVFE